MFGFGSSLDESVEVHQGISLPKRRGYGRKFDRLAGFVFLGGAALYFAFTGYIFVNVLANLDKIENFDGDLSGLASSTTTTTTRALNGRSDSSTTATSTRSGGSSGLKFDAATYEALLAATAASFGLCVGYALFIAKWPKSVMYLAPIVATFFLAIVSAVALLKGGTNAAPIAGCAALLALVMGAAILLMRERVRLAAHFLSWSMRIIWPDSLTRKEKGYGIHWGVFGFICLGTLWQFALAMWNAAAVVAAFLRWEPGQSDCTSALCHWYTIIPLIVVICFGHAWIAGLSSVVIRATVAGGPYGGFYYYDDVGYWSCRHAFRKVMSHIGTLAVGGILVDIIEALHWLISNLCRGLLACLLRGLLKALEDALEIFNRYVVIFFAVGNPCGADGGKPVEKEHHEINKQAGKNEPDSEGNRDYYMPFEETYFEAARHTLKFFTAGVLHKHSRMRRKYGMIGAARRDKGIADLVNDVLVKGALQMGTLVFSTIAAGLAFIFVEIIPDTQAADSAGHLLVIIYAFFLTFVLSYTLCSALSAGIDALFVCVAECPSMLKKRDAETYEVLSKNYRGIFDPSLLHPKGDTL